MYCVVEVRGTERKLAAGDLRVGDHFSVNSLDVGCQAALGKFLRSLKTDGSGYSIQHQVLAVSADIEENRGMLKSVIDDDDELREAEVRFGIVDPIIKGIVRCSGAALAAEETVAAREEDFLPEYSSTSGTPTASSSLPNVTPGFQRTVSEDIKPDYTTFSLHRHTDTMAHPVVAIVEVNKCKEKDKTIKEKDKRIEEKDRRIAQLEQLLLDKEGPREKRLKRSH